MAAIHKAKDNSLKLILGDHELFSEFLRDFINIDVLKDVDPADIEDITERLKKLIADVVTVLLTKINVQKEEIEDIVGKIEERGIKEMFAIENYDVQETRRIAKNEGKIEGKIEDAVKIIESLKITVSEAMRILELPKQEQEKVVKELENRNIPYVLGQ